MDCGDALAHTVGQRQGDRPQLDYGFGLDSSLAQLSAELGQLWLLLVTLMANREGCFSLLLGGHLPDLDLW